MPLARRAAALELRADEAMHEAITAAHQVPVQAVIDERDRLGLASMGVAQVRLDMVRGEG